MIIFIIYIYYMVDKCCKECISVEVKMVRILKFAGIMVGWMAITGWGISTIRQAFENQSYELNRLSQTHATAGKVRESHVNV
jgi:hypothetical protein